jgi:two-component system chemotaxis response regulator CheB
MPGVRVLVVDDSAFMRHAIGRILGEADGIEVVGSAADGVQGLQAAAQLHPDVITLDVEMPVLDGLGMLRRLMTETPTRVVMLSSLTTDGAAVTLDALEAGAIDFAAKPSGSLSINVGAIRDELVAKIRAAAAMPEATFLRHRQLIQSRARPAQAPQRPPAPRSERPQGGLRIPSRRLVVVASSTGGPSALHSMVSGLPARIGAAMVIVQHMPASFIPELANRLDRACALSVREARGGDVLAEDEVVLAPGDHHLLATSSRTIRLVQLPPVNGVRPAADVTLESVAPIWRDQALSVVLTGMGFDGCRGSRSIKDHGGAVYAQDRATSTIWGMPAAVAEAGIADRVLPLGAVARAIADWAATGALTSVARAV